MPFRHVKILWQIQVAFATPISIPQLILFFVASYNVIATLKRCLPNLAKFSIGSIEDFAHYLDEYLTILSSQQPEKITVLGLASVKDNPNEYEDSYFECDLIKPFTNLKVTTLRDSSIFTLTFFFVVRY